MKKLHYKSLKFHTVYSFVLAVVFLIMIIVVPDISLGLAMAFLILYVAGNGLIHTRNNELKRDTLMEYIILSIIVFVVIIGALN
jgi:hypothetical protein